MSEYCRNCKNLDERIQALEAALGKAVDTFEDIAQVARLLRHSGVAEAARIASVHCRETLATAETFAEPACSPGPITQEPQDYKVQCRCGWMGQVSTLKSLPEFKMGCPDCSQEFVPLNKMTFPVTALNRGGKHGT